ncbi:MBL fold metallo-hydrolase [Fluviispira sanaruensis]|uniref:Metallo-beta-lactamase domain-containing protein n=1 Tax=Fluviispira sanaruensis TaxID=2493639 RepID=A0A4P2VIW8_FLUSA|nr:MBL fold metallo-hydrolase [Fluviispira sanaruensis]BBH53103.1 hypothetical protein JCM31447_15460 [Fluviispira sanaruensis]
MYNFSYKTLSLILKCILYLISSNYLFLGCSSSTEYSISDHYDGSRFLNPSDRTEHGLWDVVKMLTTSSFEDWPESVSNSPSPNMNHALKVNEIAITFINHATVLIQVQGYNILTDPIWSKRASPYSWIGPKRHREPGIAIESLPKIDYVLISHNHYDHMDIETLKKLNEIFAPHFVVPLGNKKFLLDNDILNVSELDWWETDKFNPNIQLSLAPAHHASARGLFDRNKTLWGSFLISINKQKIYFAGDTAYSSHFAAIRKRFGAPDIALLPIGAYEPRWFMKLVHMNPTEAVKAHLDLGAKQSIGIHFGTFQLTQERIDQPRKDLNLELKNKQLNIKEFITLDEGQTRIFKLNN